MPETEEPIEMSSRRRGCWDSSRSNCCDLLGEARMRKSAGRLIAVMVAISLAMLALPAALLADDSRDTMRMPLLAESRSHFTSEQKRLLKIARIEVQAGARGRTASHAQPHPPPSAPQKKDWLFSKQGLKKSMASKEELLLNLLKNLDQPCDKMCTKTAGKDVETLHFCRTACRESKVHRMRNLITELNSRSKDDASRTSSGQEGKSHGTKSVHATSKLESDSKRLAATAKKLAHGNISREVKLVHWAERHGLQTKIARDVLSRLEPQSAKPRQQHEHGHAAPAASDADAGEAKQQDNVDQKAKDMSRLRAQKAAKRQRQAARRRLAAQDKTYLRGLSTHRLKLIKWAEANGLPKKLAENPVDKGKVKKIIARMKAEAVVASIKHQFRKDDSKVGDIVHAADPAASKSLYAGLDYS